MSRARTLTTTVIVLAIVAGALYALWPAGQNTAQKGFGAALKRFGPGGAPPNIEQPVPVIATPARKMDVPVYLDGVGTARALNTVTVRAQVDGKLLSINFKEGQDVARGDILARVDPTLYQAQLDQAAAKKAQDEAQLANARLDLERFTRLAASNAATKQQADTQQALVNQLEALVKLDQAAIDNARAVLGYTNVIAPISGRTGIRQVDEGNLVRASDTTGLVVITQIKPISVFFSLPQQNIAQVNRGMAEGSLPVEALGADGVAVVDRGKLVVVDNQVDQTTGTVKLRAEFANDTLQLWPGQFVNVRLLIDTLRQVIVVPTAAVQRGPDGTFVYVITAEERASVRKVSVSQQNDVQTVVDRGLEPDDRVVTTGFARLADNSRVRVVPEGGGPPGAAPPGRTPEAGRDRRRPQKTGANTGAPAATTAGATGATR